VFEASQWPLSVNIVAFLAAALVITAAGIRLARVADQLADRTGLGEALTGTIFLAVSTSLPGLVASITAALEGRPALAISNAVGGIAVQTVFLALADISYRKANLEHAAASIQNMIQAALLITMLSLLLIGFTGPDITLGPVHAVSPLLLLTAVFGMVLVFRSGEKPMWRPSRTRLTVPDVPDEDAKRMHLGLLLGTFAATAVLVAIAGAVVASTTGVIADRTGISETMAGALLSGLVTSIPELVTTLAAVRRGALTLAVSDIVGGNFFDVLFIFAADVAFLSGSIYHADGVGPREIFLTVLTLLLSVILLLGLLYRQRQGPANIGFESLLMLLTYVLGYLALAAWM
jgi:cation:H+ antiporter